MCTRLQGDRAINSGVRKEIQMASVVKRVVVMIQENHTTDNYFRGLAPFGAAVASDWPISANPPAPRARTSSIAR